VTGRAGWLPTHRPSRSGPEPPPVGQRVPPPPRAGVSPTRPRPLPGGGANPRPVGPRPLNTMPCCPL
jgi:hypothetical protein